jgi:hypothetical protein
MRHQVLKFKKSIPNQPAQLADFNITKKIEPKKIKP